MLAFPKLYEVPWAILPGALESYIENSKDIQAIESRSMPSEKKSSVAWLPLFGPISQRADMWMEMFGGTSTEEFGAVFDGMIANKNVGSIVIEIDSPGGGVYGVHELSEKIFNARGKKPIVAVANSLAASAAYWIGTAADELIVTPSGEVGSVGVFTMHTDISAFEAELGVKRTFIQAGKFKTEGNPYQPLKTEAEKAIQARVNDYYDTMTSDIARYRGTSQLNVKNSFAGGRVVGADEAIDRGMADKVGTLETAIQRMSRQRSKRTMRSKLDLVKIKT